MNSSFTTDEETKTVWPFGKFGHAYSLNKSQYRLYRITWGSLRISALIIFIANILLSNYFHDHFGWSKNIFFLPILLVGLIFLFAVHRITSSASVAHSAPLTPPPNTDPPPFNAIGITLGLIVGIGSAIWAVLCALVLIAALVHGDKIEPGILVLFLGFSAGSVLSIRRYKRRKN